MIELSTIRDLVAIFGVIAGFSYYVLTVRNANRTRKIQLMMDIRDRMLDRDYLLDSVEVMELEWEDFDDFRKKYDSTVNPDSFSRRWQVWQGFESIGFMLHQGIIDIETIYSMIGPTSILQHWQKFESIFKEQKGSRQRHRVCIEAARN